MKYLKRYEEIDQDFENIYHWFDDHKAYGFEISLNIKPKKTDFAIREFLSIIYPNIHFRRKKVFIN